MLWRKKKTLGQTVAEYALIVALVAIASIGILKLFGNHLRDLYHVMTQRLAGKEDATQTDKFDESEVEHGLGDAL